MPRDNVAEGMSGYNLNQIQQLQNNQGVDLFSLPGYVTGAGQSFNGGILSNLSKSITVPVGSTGQNTYIQFEVPRLPYSYELFLSGQKITLIYLVQITPGFITKKALTAFISVWRGTTEFNGQQTGTPRFIYLSQILVRIEIDYIPLSNDNRFWPALQLLSSSDTSAGSLTVLSLRFIVASQYCDTTLAPFLARSIAPWKVQYVVKPDGTGDYLTPYLANIAILAAGDASPTKWYEITVYPGIYTDINWNAAPFTHWIGTDRETCWFQGSLPASSSDSAISSTSTISFNSTHGDFILERLKITAQNMRYPIHDDSGGTIQNAKRHLIDCHIEHYGNAAVVAYRAANSLPAGSVWPSCWPYGFGSSSGLYSEFDRCLLRGPIGGFYVHNNADFALPNVNHLKHCKLDVTNYSVSDSPRAVYYEDLGSGTNDKIIMEGCEINGIIFVDDTPWQAVDLAHQYSDHDDFKIYGHGNTCVGYQQVLTGQALMITSATNSGTSQVTLSGTAVPVLLGNLNTFTGLGGLQGQVYGSFDVSGTVAISSMGKRLGNCTSTPLTLTVQFESQAAITITFNLDYTSVSNASILSTINTALGSEGAASLFNPGVLTRPNFMDERLCALNTSAVGIPQGSAVKRGASFATCLLMTSSDDQSLFLGFAEQNINPGDTGTIKVKGVVGTADVLLDASGGSVVFTQGNWLGISTTKPGYLINVGTKASAVGMGISTNWFKIYPTNGG